MIDLIWLYYEGHGNGMVACERHAAVLVLRPGSSWRRDPGVRLPSDARCEHKGCAGEGRER